MGFDRVLTEKRKFVVKNDHQHFSSLKDYEELYRQSIKTPEAFWLEQSKQLDWIHPPSSAFSFNWDRNQGPIYHFFFSDGFLNVSVNCLDRHILSGKGEQVAYYWEGDDHTETQIWTYQNLYEEVNRLGNVLRNMGVQKGDRVGIYLPLLPQATAAMLACARIGAVHSVIFAGFSSEALAERLADSSCSLLITADYSCRGGKKIPLLEAARRAAAKAPSVQELLVLSRGTSPCHLDTKKEKHYHEELEKAELFCPPETMSAEDPLFILYTSGSTGKPKGLLHTQAGYLLHASLSQKFVFDLGANDVYWCTADIGWITGHSYGVYGPLCNGCTSVLFEGIPNSPTPDRIWQIVDKYKVSILYTAPTLIRALMKEGDDWVEPYDLSTLRVLGTVGEPINPEAWVWYYSTVGKERLPLIDTWWQTETGGILLTHIPGLHTLKPGFAGRPFLGIQATIAENGDLCLSHPWPGIARSMWGDHKRFEETYFSQHPGFYFSGDGAQRDSEGDYCLVGRTDDIVNVSGHRLGTAEIESALVSHPSIAEAAVVATPHEIKGEALHAYVIPLSGVNTSGLSDELSAFIREKIGPIAVPESIIITPDLPKTRSGKIMRRILRKLAAGENDLGDLSTLTNPDLIQKLIKNPKYFQKQSDQISDED